MLLKASADGFPVFMPCLHRKIKCFNFRAVNLQ